MIEIIVSIIIAIIISSLYLYLAIKIKNTTHILLISVSLLITLILLNLFVIEPIINFIITFTIITVLYLFFSKVIKSMHSISIFQEEIIKE